MTHASTFGTKYHVRMKAQAGLRSCVTGKRLLTQMTRDKGRFLFTAAQDQAGKEHRPRPHSKAIEEDVPLTQPSCSLTQQTLTGCLPCPRQGQPVEHTSILELGTYTAGPCRASGMSRAEECLEAEVPGAPFPEGSDSRQRTSYNGGWEGRGTMVARLLLCAWPQALPSARTPPPAAPERLLWPGQYLQRSIVPTMHY
ncbi:hypothetical protein QTO34_019633 [Cnephaeus nilssonii]|uniref:Uncharacterized protein n=1 Tax=Cnephaeus nilssonii TaxID=3371016 RepID=A0AA40HWY6_CNENI|nr:hypothetical protein QTO34_019633 [Eptesicus nilssonii]